ncbi:N-acetyltransferase [Spirosoma sp. HMF4905]|uniref:N-acetyltransferase n=1 Tax=Spirosoma arboris TaxID=2682092 RepID=A0A7K1SCD8_9BACT|nr:GNAT family N-acetyltransferase [Spirosoma arboris]MVM31469.1 N-acetyltransferase [Spirosoma arboris]
MNIQIYKTSEAEIEPFRVLFLQEINAQFVCNKCHQYGWADVYLFTIDDTKVGYGSIWGTDRREDRDTIFEFYVLPPFRKFVNLLFPKFTSVSGGSYIESQTNDALLAAMTYEYARNINAEAILFEDHITTNFTVSDAIFRQRTGDDESDDDSPYVLEQNGVIVASGGLMLNYNMPFADVYMQVKEDFRQQGLGSLLVQELKKMAYLMGRVPAARCNTNNPISKAALQKAGLRACGFRLKGELVNNY